MDTKDKEPLVFPEPRKLAFGVYKATEEFKSVDLHSCVCYADDLGLVATTGPAGDPLSEKYAELFASAPAQAERITALEQAMGKLLADMRLQEYYGFSGELAEFPEIASRHMNEAGDLLAKARGQS